jgi:hypothetical protein
MDFPMPLLTLPQNIVCLWEGSITSYDAALQLVLIVDYIVDWARDIFRLGIMRQLMSVVDRGTQSAYTIIEDHDILSTRDYANSWFGDRPAPTIGGAEAAEVPAGPAFDAIHSTVIESPLEPLFKSTGDHVDIRVWDCAKYEARVRGLYITGNDTAAETHLMTSGFDRFRTVHMRRCWFFLPNAQDIKIIEQAWTGSENSGEVQDLSEERILVSLYVQYRTGGDGTPIRELTYIALTESIAQDDWELKEIIERNALEVSAEVLGIHLGEAWASSQENYFKRYAGGQTSALCVTASDIDRLSHRVTLSFQNDRDITPYARRTDSFIRDTCEDPRARLHKVYSPCYRYTKAVHSLTVEPHCIFDPTEACVFINTEAMASGICAYITNPLSEEVNTTWVIQHFVQVVAVIWKNEWRGTKNASYPGRRDDDRKILLWIVSDPQWDSYVAVKSTLTMPGMDKVHKHLAWFRKVLLRHKCETGTHGADRYKEGYRNVQCDIQDVCKNCDFEWWGNSRLTAKPLEYQFCKEDYMPR